MRKRRIFQSILCCGRLYNMGPFWHNIFRVNIEETKGINEPKRPKRKENFAAGSLF
jgi:hypothetical protein